MWGAIGGGVDLAGVVILVVIWIRMANAYQRAGVRFLAMSALVGLPSAVRKRLMSAIRHGDVVPAELQDVALRWAHQEVLRRGVCWSSIVGMVMMVSGLPTLFASTERLSAVAFWLDLVVLCGMVLAFVYVWRDQLAAARLLRGSSRPA
ncbi:hypothetical protein [Kutzneria buriramensis]|uniref:Uncharacterized protein n=1 Tax=Kutzneria buriramensis TaxID=1045776 RepID=A0A3E0GZ55_9PSEU|nr:hypothetical protein [Kutzneria buriramensis]REH32588.1 hypothetical protein BCF44_121137 [Kutzneria buriramensis]